MHAYGSSNRAAAALAQSPGVLLSGLVSSQSLPCLRPAEALPDGAFPPVGRLGLTSPPSPVLCAATTATLPLSGRFACRSLPDTAPASLVCGVPEGLVGRSKRPDSARACGHPVPHSGHVVKETAGSPTFPRAPSADMPRSSGRNTARATVGRACPSCTLSGCAAGSAFRHRARCRQPPAHPGRSDGPRPVGSQCSSCVRSPQPSHRHGGFRARPPTPLIHLVGLAESPRRR